MKVEITIPEAEISNFSKIQLGYINLDGARVDVPLNIDFKNLYKFTRQKEGTSLDVFLIGCLVYGIDILLSRQLYSPNGWSREIEVEFPVENIDLFESVKKELSHLLSFLTGDFWLISFVKRTNTNLYKVKSKSKVYIKDYRDSFKKVSLFSGGLDSLVGVIDQLSSSSEKIILASHYDATFSGAKSDQDGINAKLYPKYRKQYHLVQTRVDLSNSDTNGNKIQHESTLRSRSFLFLSQAVFIAHSVADNLVILIPENGTISLNHPLTPSRRSSCSTRTAHPYYLNKVADFIQKLGLNHNIINEYEKKTKGEMLVECKDRETLLSTYTASCSCAKRGTRKDIRDVTSGTNHCGICMPCLYRRVSLHKIGLDTEIVGTNLFNPKKYSLESLPDIPAFLDYMKKTLSLEDIEKNLLVNGSLPLNEVKAYADVIVRAREEISQWIHDKGDNKIKRILNIK